ncbi:MAG: peptidoglycan DD-metalloendopeptidase family protein [Bacteroidales bacterium]|nr:peptidoglycan DD-metalloendopeptidase family protein [Bacteroidales bacterium]
MITNLLKKYKSNFANIFNFDLNEIEVYDFDFSVKNEELYPLDLLDTDILTFYVNSKLQDHNCNVGIGGYAEDRLIYKRSSHFGSGKNARSIHLGIDIWTEAATPIFAFMDSKIHSFKNNNNFGDYGPTIILEHEIENVKFYSLYGHLSKASLNALEKGQYIKKGQKIAEIGNDKENGQWPPHLHFQLITDLLGKTGDFYGVCSTSEKDKFLSLCPNPKIILNYG